MDRRVLQNTLGASAFDAQHLVQLLGLGEPALLLEDGDRLIFRTERTINDVTSPVLVVVSATEISSSTDQLKHELDLKDDLDPTWAVRPLEILRESGRTLLVLADPGGLPLELSLGSPMDIGASLRLGIGIAAALGRLHQSGLVHMDLKPANILVDSVTDDIRFTGFGLTSRLPRERRSPGPPETIAGTLAYMAPEQTGRMNRSIDSRSDLYSVGVILYRVITGVLPFSASDPMEWVHCHIARRPLPAHERRAELPIMVSAILAKLLQKMGEDRYQTAAAVERDLSHCLAEWQRQGNIAAFALGKSDVSDRITIPEKLYGRSRELNELTAAFDRVTVGGAPELLLVFGYPGVGKIFAC